jgi:hypothetical protein
VSEPSYLSGDPFSNSNYTESVQEVECGECGQLAEVPTTEEYSHGETTWWAEWICICGESNSDEGSYDPNFRD